MLGSGRGKETMWEELEGWGGVGIKGVIGTWSSHSIGQVNTRTTKDTHNYSAKLDGKESWFEFERRQKT